MTKSTRLFLLYGVAVVLVFGAVGIYLARSQNPTIPAVIEWLIYPGFLIALVVAGVHSDHVELAMTMANIGIYTAIPYLSWTLFEARRKRDESEP